jgi:tungstate transport system permease protein
VDVLIDSFTTALKLIFTGDREMYSIAARTLFISIASTLAASVIFIPIGSVIHFYDFPFKGTLINIIQTFYSLPTVFVGMLVFIAFSRAGPLGFMGQLFSQEVMIIGQVALIAPIMMGLTNSALNAVGPEIRETAVSLGASTTQAIVAVLREARFGITTAVLLGFGRAISEVGLAIMVGGNIRGYTRMLTTAMALGTTVVALALMINVLVSHFQLR